MRKVVAICLCAAFAAQNPIFKKNHNHITEKNHGNTID